MADISHALSRLTEPAPVPIHKLSVTNMVHSAKKKIRKHRGVDESPLNNEVLNAILLVSKLCCLSCFDAGIRIRILQTRVMFVLMAVNLV